MSTYKLAVFDLAGTTVRDTNTVGACLQGALAEVGVSVTVADANSVMGIPKPVSIRLLLERYGKEGDIDSIHQDFRRRMIDTYRTSAEIGEIEGASEVFRALGERGIRVSVDTGFDRETTDVLFERLNWGALVQDSICSDEVERGRPHPDMILELCRRAGVNPAATIKLGDTPSDIQEGKSAGAGLVVACAYGTHTAGELAEYQPDAILNALSDLLDLDL